MIKYINESDFGKEIENKRVLICFYASWCGPCKMLGLVLDKFSQENSIEILKINTDENQSLSEKLSIFSIPTLIIFENGKEIKRITGYLSYDELKKWVNV